MPGQHSTKRVTPDPGALNLAKEMMSMEGVMWDILDETIPEDGNEDTVVRESGRTICAAQSDIKGPLARFPTSVELASCPRGTGGTWHSHVTRDQLQSPSNSLPDTANVIFGEVDVSVVVGTQGAEAVVKPQDPDAGVATFRNAIGADVASSKDVVDAILGGRIPDPTEARRRVRSKMGTLFHTRNLHFSELNRRLQTTGIPASSVASFEMVEAQRYHSISYGHGGGGESGRSRRKHPLRNPRGMRRHCRRTNRAVKRKAEDMGIPEKVTSSAIGAIVGNAVSSLWP